MVTFHDAVTLIESIYGSQRLGHSKNKIFVSMKADFLTADWAVL
jgi:hypothetical protein